jgi:2-aminoethylphosphonate-pyruvate transaminase
MVLMDPRIPYLLLTPGPVTTSPGVRSAMHDDCCTWVAEYAALVDDMRRRLVHLACPPIHRFAQRARETINQGSLPGAGRTCILLQGTGSYAVEATLGSVVPPTGKVLIVDNGAYGQRMVVMAEKMKLPHRVIEFPETEPADPSAVDRTLAADPAITHVATPRRPRAWSIRWLPSAGPSTTGAGC